MSQFDPVELADAAANAGVDLGALNEWYNSQASKAIPAFRGAETAEDVVNLYKTVRVADRLQDLEAREAPTAVAAPQSVDVVGRRPPIPTTVNPYAGSAQEVAAGENGNPSARSLSQYDPAAVSAAQADFNRKWEENATGRNIGNFLAAFGGAGEYARQVDQDAYTRLKDSTVGAQLRQQEAATAGLTAASNESARLRNEGAFTGTQREQQQKLDLGQVAVNTAKRMNDPASPETILAKAMLADQLKTAGIANPELSALLASGNITAQQMLGFMDPKVLEAYKTKIGILGEQQSTRKTAAEAESAEVGAKLAKTVTKNGTELPPGAVVGVSAGPVTINNPGAGVKSQAEAERQVGLAERAENWRNFGIPAVDRITAILDKGVYSGKGNAALAAYLGDDDAQYLITNLAKLSAMSPSMFPADIAAALANAQKEGGYSGRLLGSMPQPVLRQLLADLKADMNRQFTSGADRSATAKSGGDSTARPLEPYSPIVTPQMRQEAQRAADAAKAQPPVGEPDRANNTPQDQLRRLRTDLASIELGLKKAAPRSAQYSALNAEKLKTLKQITELTKSQPTAANVPASPTPKPAGRIVVTSQQQYDNLPAGTEFVDDKGNIGKKK